MMKAESVSARVIAMVAACAMGTVALPSGTLSFGIHEARAQGAVPAKDAKPAKDAQAGDKEAGAASRPATLAEAKKAYGAGEQKLAAEDYEGALAEFEFANGVKSTPQAARYIALCHDKLGRYPEAMVWYERFLADVPEKLESQASAARDRVAEIKAMPGKVHVEVVHDGKPVEGAKLEVDGKPAQMPPPADLELEPGEHIIIATAEGYKKQEKKVAVAFASTQEVSMSLAEKSAPVPAGPAPGAVAAPPPGSAEQEPTKDKPSLIPAYVTGGIAVAAAGVGTAFGIMALNDKSEYDKTPTSELADDGENHALVADMAFGLAITFGVTSAVLFLTHDEPAANASAKRAPAKIAKPKKSDVSVSAAPIVTPHGGGAGALIRF